MVRSTPEHAGVGEALNIVDLINAGEIDIVVEHAVGRRARADGYEIRAAAVAGDKALLHDDGRARRRCQRAPGAAGGLRGAGASRSTPEGPTGARMTRSASGSARRFADARPAVRRHRPARAHAPRGVGTGCLCRRRARVRAARGRGGRAPASASSSRRSRSSSATGRPAWHAARGRPRRPRAPPVCVVIADAKRGDIGSTMDAYAEAWLTPGCAAGGRRADGEPVPRRGHSRGGRSTWRRRHGKGVFVLAATSNPEAFTAQRGASSRRRDGVGARSCAEVSARNARTRRRRGGGAWASSSAAPWSGRMPALTAFSPSAPILGPGFGHQGAGTAISWRARFGGAGGSGDSVGEPQHPGCRTRPARRAHIRARPSLRGD